ncbi:DUF1028 domain-containing protein [Subtercola frigoramans]|uniref:Ntn-hydrolase superfamily protein n=1 Tax=Subtercola frigoramans TaxID=120298 RepID=A0ABS2L0V0_9MICO|nr:DUF1028 domain-containing protein [Subtercola frigoramans]MBM7470711.1 putative Ntn-hydrolase superfamily protein [Subtercola frigoramans]
MTFSLVARDGATGAIGAVICSSSPAVAARCVHLGDGTGGVLSQNVTDPRLGPRLLDLLAQGLTAPIALASLVSSSPEMQWRQLVVVDTSGNTAIHSGSNALGIVGEHAEGGAAAAGNMLATPDVPRQLVEAWHASSGAIEVRLLAAFEAAMTEGGEAGPVHSAGLSVIDGHGWRVTDLRVDWSEDPLDDLRTLVEIWLPQRDAYISRALTPDASPTYGVPGDSRV